MVQHQVHTHEEESCKLVGATKSITATESHLIPNLSTLQFKEDCENLVKLTTLLEFSTFGVLW